MSWLVLCRFVPVCLAVLPHRFYNKNTAVWVVECDRFKTFLKCLPSGDLTINCVFMKNERGLGKFMRTHLSPQIINPDWLAFLSRFKWKVFPFKSYWFFLNFLFLYKCRKSLNKDCLSTSQLGNHGTGQADDDGAVSTRILHAGNLLLANRCSIIFNDKH